MAIISVNSSAKLDSFTWTDADQFYIYNGSTLTIDADPTAKAGVGIIPIAGQDIGASIVVDSRQIKHITVSNTTGMTYGKVITGSTSGATGYCIKVSSTGVIKYRSTSTAQFVSGETVTGTGISATTSSVPRVAMMFLPVTFFGSFAMFLGGKFEALGEWCELGTANGGATFTLPADYEKAYVLPSIEVETGVGTNVYNKWTLMQSGRTLSNYGNGENGRVFTHVANATTIGFGNGTNGLRPVNGARIRVPNCYFNGCPVEYTNNGRIICNKVTNISISQSTTGIPEEVSLQHVFTNQSININKSTNVNTFTNVALSGEVALSYCKNVSFTDAAMWYHQAFTTFPAYTFLQCHGVTYNNTIVQTNSTLLMNACTNISSQNTRTYNLTGTAWIGYTNCQNATITNGSHLVKIEDGSSNVTVDGSDVVVYMKNASNITLKKTKILGSFTGQCNDIVMSGVGAVAPFYDSIILGTNQIPTTNNITIQNFRCNSVYFDADPMWGQGSLYWAALQNFKVKGFQGMDMGVYAMGNLLNGATDMNTYDGFNAAGTAGQVGCVFQKETTPKVFTFVAGSPVLRGNGQLHMPNLNDEVHITWDYFIKGHSSLQNVAATIRTSVASATPASTNITVYYDIDNGSGFSGTWKLATGANLSGETINVAGFKPKFRLVTTTANAGNLVSIFYISTTTSQAAINANHYPIRPTIATVTISPVVDNSEVRIYAAGTQTDIAGIENTSGGSFSYTYEHTGDFNVDIQVMHNNYEYIKIFNVTLTDTDSTIPIQQVPDNLYYNP